MYYFFSCWLILLIDVIILGIIQLFSLMNKLYNYRLEISKKIRNQQLNQLKENIRNLNLYKLALHFESQQCPLCINSSWLSQTSQACYSKLIISIHRQNQICTNHMEKFIQKVIENLQKFPQNFTQFIFYDQFDKKEHFIRKLFILKTIFENSQLLKNQLFWLQIEKSIYSMDQFTRKVMYYAFEYESQMIIQLKDISKEIKIEKLCLRIVMFIFYRYPFLFQNLFAIYTIDILIEKHTDKNKDYLYQYLHDLYVICSEDQCRYKTMLINLQIGLQNHIEALQFSIRIDKHMFKLIMSWILEYLSKSEIKTSQSLLRILHLMEKHDSYNLIEVDCLRQLIKEKYSIIYSEYFRQKDQSQQFLIDKLTFEVKQFNNNKMHEE